MKDTAVARFRIHRRRARIVFLLAAVATVIVFNPPRLAAQDPNYDPNRSGSANETSQAAKPNMAEANSMEYGRAAATRARFLREYYDKLKKDSNRMMELATEFKDYAGNSSDQTLSKDMLKKIGTLEEKAHDLRKVLYNQNVPQVKKSGTDLVPQPGSQGESAHRFLPAAERCYALATHIRDVMASYLKDTNRNEFNVSSEHLGAAKELVNTAAGVEGLAYELRHPADSGAK